MAPAKKCCSSAACGACVCTCMGMQCMDCAKHLWGQAELQIAQYINSDDGSYWRGTAQWSRCVGYRKEVTSLSFNLLSLSLALLLLFLLLPLPLFSALVYRVYAFILLLICYFYFMCFLCIVCVYAHSVRCVCVCALCFYSCVCVCVCVSFYCTVPFCSITSH